MLRSNGPLCRGIIVFVLLFALLGCSTISAPTPSSLIKSAFVKSTLVKTTQGDISGSFADGVFSYKGIPYAKAERFMPPLPADTWTGVRAHTEYSKIAMQVNSWSSPDAMDENSLFTLNIWTQGINDRKKRPVMVWLHGGGFSVGSGTDPMTDGAMLARKGDVVLVSINHRLNILGYLDLSAFGPQYAQSANVGMLDIVAALLWVHNNISNFGGDAKNVTIFGESGGGGKVGTLMSMPAAKGLFHKAIIQSGTLHNVMSKDKSVQVGQALVDILGLSKDTLPQINTIAYSQLVAAGNKALEKTVGLRVPGSKTMFGFCPVADGVTLLQQPFTPDFADISQDIPLLIGTTFNELVKTAYAQKSLSLADAKLRLNKIYADKTQSYVDLFAKAYPDFTPQDLLSIDNLFRPNTIATADARSAKNAAPVYTYLLNWKSPVEDNNKGAFHGLDVPLVFNNIELGKHWTGTSAEAVAVAQHMSDAWINFAKTGNPNHKNLPKWPAYAASNGATLIFDRQIKLLNNHDRQLMQLIKSYP